MKNDLNDTLIEISKSIHELSFCLAGAALDFHEENEEIANALEEASELLQEAELIVDENVVHSTTYLLLKVNGEFSRVEIPYDSFNERIHELIGCECYELVSYKEDYYFCVDELGKCYETPKPDNKKASLFYPGMLHGDMIVGDVVIGKLGYVDGEPDMVGLNEDELQRFEKILGAIRI